MEKRPTLRIGTEGTTLCNHKFNVINELLADQGYGSIPVMVQVADERNDFIRNAELALLNNEIDVAVHSLGKLSVKTTDGIRIGAVCAPYNPASCLLIRKEAYSPGEDLFLKSGALVGVAPLSALQLSSLKSDLQLKITDGTLIERINGLQKAEFDAILASVFALDNCGVDVSEFEILHLNPREFVPAAGQGVLALKVRTNDEPTLHAVKHVHDSNAFETISVERKIHKQLADDGRICLGVHCTKDHQNYYHVWAVMQSDANSIKKIQVSSSTSFELAESTVHQLLS